MAAVGSTVVRKYTSLFASRWRSEEPLLKEEGWIPAEDDELNLLERYTTREYFAYVNVADIPYPPHPQNTTDKWHSTGPTPSELIEVITRLRVIMQVVRAKEGDIEPSHHYWKSYWHKHDQANGFVYSGSHSWARTYDACYQYFKIEVEKYGEQYRPVSGFHRIFLAKQMGLEKLPVWLIEHLDA
jgi:hypothetical protein